MAIINIREGNILEGARLFSETIATTMGPFGKKCLLDKGFSVVTGTDDGFELAKVINLPDESKRKGEELIKEAVVKTHERVGDGCSAACVLTYEIIREGVKNIVAGTSAVSLCKGLNKGLELCIGELEKMSVAADKPDVLMKVAKTAAKEEVLIENVAQVFDEVCTGKAVGIEEASGLETRVERQSGMAIDNGYSSPYFIKDKGISDLELENVYVLMSDRVIFDFNDLIPVIEYVNEQSASLLVLSAGVAGEALSNLLLNVHKNGLKAAAVTAGGYGISGNEVLEDAAVYTGGKVVYTNEWQLAEDWKYYLGKAKKVKIKQNCTMISGGGGALYDVSKYIAVLEGLYENEENKAKRLALRNRMSRLSDERIIIKVGGKTGVECEEMKNRYEKAFSSVHGAYNSGVCPGGGVAYLRCVFPLRSLAATLPYEERTGVLILAKALEAPAYNIIKNAGGSGERILAELLELDLWQGYDVVKEDFCELFDSGILDATEVVKEAIRNAVSAAKACLMAERFVVKNKGSVSIEKG